MRAYRRESSVLPEALSDAERVAYLAVRLPATYAAISKTLMEVSRIEGPPAFRTLLDVGAGPGTASIAARHVYPSLTKFRQLERDPGWSDVAARLSTATGVVAAQEAGDFSTATIVTHDVVIAAYAINEAPKARLEATIQRLWQAAGSILLIVEPGTPDGFSLVRRAREICLENGGFAAAPCTHDATCPMSREDWCHSAVRVERSALHRKLKDAQLAFEDEKFAYVVMSRRPVPRHAGGRIVRRPIRSGGHVHLDLCDASGLHRATIARSNRAAYKAARAAEWGDAWTTPNDGATD